MNLKDLKTIEKKYNFNYPKVYYRLLNDGMLDCGLTCSDWFKTEFPKLKSNPPFLLFGEDFEIISSKEELVELIDDFSDEDDYRQRKNFTISLFLLEKQEQAIYTVSFLTIKTMFIQLFWFGTIPMR